METPYNNANYTAYHNITNKTNKILCKQEYIPLSYNEITINYGHRLYSYSKYK